MKVIQEMSSDTEEIAGTTFQRPLCNFDQDRAPCEIVELWECLEELWLKTPRSNAKYFQTVRGDPVWICTGSFWMSQQTIHNCLSQGLSSCQNVILGFL